jgi:hypothetical protein
MGWFLWFRQIKQYQRNELLEFIEEFRRRAMDYVYVAMRDLEALDEYLRRLASRPVNGRGPRWRANVRDLEIDGLIFRANAGVASFHALARP